MKILHVTPSLSNTWGGPTRVIKGLTESLHSKGVVNTIFATTGNRVGYVEDSDLQSDVRLFPAQPLSVFWTGYSKPLIKILSEEIHSHDLVHIHELWHFPHFAAYLSAKRAGKPYCISIHGHLSPWALNHKKLRKQMYMNVLQKRTISQASALHAITREEVSHIKALGFSTETRLIPNGIYHNTNLDVCNKSDFLQKYPSLKNKKVLLFLGRIHPVKGLDLLTEAFSEIVKRDPNIYLIIAGPDENGYKEHVQNLLKKTNTHLNCIFTGMLSEKDKAAALQAADLLVLPSYSEVMGIATLEGMDAGLPVVITEACQFPEVQNNGAGLVVPHNSNDLCNAILHILDNPNIAKQMGIIGKQLIANTYNWNCISDQYIDLYLDIMKKQYEPKH